MYDYEESYYEPTIADEILMEFQQKMKDVLLESVKYQIEKIKEENIQIKEQNNKLQEQVNKIAQKERELEIKKKNLKWEVRKERLSELMKDFQVIMYKTDTTHPKPPKCNKCNKDRQIEFKSPSGKTIHESCSCNTGKTFYVPQEYICTKFNVDRDGKTMSMWYKENHESDYDWYDYSGSNFCVTVYKNGMKYEDLKRYDTYFRSKEECQGYCDWLNSNTKEN